MSCLVPLAAVATDLDVLSAAADAAAGSGDRFALVIEQDGRWFAPGSGETVPLRRAPFVLWIVYTDATNVMLHVSADPALAEAVADGVNPARAVPYFDELMGMAEAEHNPDHSLYISQYGAHYLPPPDADLVRFNRVIWGAGFVAGGRDVARLFIEDLGQQLRLEQLSFDTIYLTAMHTRRDPKMRQQLVAGRAVGVRLQ